MGTAATHRDAGSNEAAAPPVAMTMPATVPECHVVIQSMALQIDQLREQMAWPQERLKVDSRNSSKPPSSDGPGSGNRAQRRASQRQRGAQKGHPGAYRALLPEAEVDAVHDCAPVAVCDCGGTVGVQGKPLRHLVKDWLDTLLSQGQARVLPFGGVGAGTFVSVWSA